MDDTKKTWTVTTHDNKNYTVSGTRVELNTNQARTTFYDGDEVVASFVGVNGFIKND